MSGTRERDVALAAIAALDEDEQDQVLAELRQRRLRAHAGEESHAERLLGSVQRVAEAVGRAPTVTDYRMRAHRDAIATLRGAITGGESPRSHLGNSRDR